MHESMCASCHVRRRTVVPVAVPRAQRRCVLPARVEHVCRFGASWVGTALLRDARRARAHTAQSLQCARERHGWRCCADAITRMSCGVTRASIMYGCKLTPNAQRRYASMWLYASQIPPPRCPCSVIGPSSCARGGCGAASSHPSPLVAAGSARTPIASMRPTSASREALMPSNQLAHRS